jgi:hypothetical protein
MLIFACPSHPRAILYMGEDKHENESLIAGAIPTDMWFHVDNMSSAHVYLRWLGEREGAAGEAGNPEAPPFFEVDAAYFGDVKDEVDVNPSEEGLREAWRQLPHWEARSLWPRDVAPKLAKGKGAATAEKSLTLRPGWVLDYNAVLDDVPEDVVSDAAQLVKANSIEGCKRSNVRVVYTPAANLQKRPDMAVGQVGFHAQSLVRTTTVEHRVNRQVNAMNKTKVDLGRAGVDEMVGVQTRWQARVDRVVSARGKAAKEAGAQRKADARAAADTRAYRDLKVDESKLRTAKQNAAAGLDVEEFEDDFM